VSQNMLFYGERTLTPSSSQTTLSINSRGDIFGKPPKRRKVSTPTSPWGRFC